MPGSLTTPDRPGARAGALARVAFRFGNSVGIRNHGTVAARWLVCNVPCRLLAPGLPARHAPLRGLAVPRPTLRPWPRGQTRTARGRRGSLLLRRIGLSPTTPGRSPGALSNLIDRNLSHSEGRGGTKRRGGRLACDGFRSPGRGNYICE